MPYTAYRITQHYRDVPAATFNAVLYPSPQEAADELPRLAMARDGATLWRDGRVAVYDVGDEPRPRGAYLYPIVYRRTTYPLECAFGGGAVGVRAVKMLARLSTMSISRAGWFIGGRWKLHLAMLDSEFGGLMLADNGGKLAVWQERYREALKYHRARMIGMASAELLLTPFCALYDTAKLIITRKLLGMGMARWVLENEVAEMLDGSSLAAAASLVYGSDANPYLPLLTMLERGGVAAVMGDGESMEAVKLKMLLDTKAMPMFAASSQW